MYYAGRKTFKDRLQRYNPLLFTTKFYLIYFTVSGGRDRCVVVVKIKKPGLVQTGTSLNKYGSYLLSRMVVQYHRP